MANILEISPKNIVHQLAKINPSSFLIKYKTSNATDDEISAINIDLNHNNTLLEEENKKLTPLRDIKMESAAKLQKSMSNCVQNRVCD